MTAAQLTFIDYKKPRLDSGEYTLSVAHQVGDYHQKPQAQASGKINIKVQGEKLTLGPNVISSMYPPPGEQGNFSNSLAHVVFNKATLPWVRSANCINQQNTDVELPWLYLMIVNQNDVDLGLVKLPKEISAQQLSTGAYFPQSAMDIIKNDPKLEEIEGKPKVVDINSGLFKQLIAQQPEQLAQQAHVRRNQTDQTDTSVLIANRFGQSYQSTYPDGTRNHALVVSVEKYFEPEHAQQIQNLPDDAMVRLIVLHQWSFNCINSDISFPVRAEAITAASHSLANEKFATADEETKAKIASGLLALPHEMRTGDQTISWYRGPLSPYLAPNSDNILLSPQQMGHLFPESPVISATDADRLITYSASDGMFDINNAAAYELGRFLSINNANYSKTLAKYKHMKARRIKLTADDDARRDDAAQLGMIIDNMPYSKLDATDEHHLEQELLIWLKTLVSLKDIPAWYLLPDPALLPNEHLHTFTIEPLWLQSLLLGAISICGRPQLTYQIYQNLYSQLAPDMPSCGILLRSNIVNIYPELTIELRNINQAGMNGKIDINELAASKGAQFNEFIHSFSCKAIKYRHCIANDCQLLLLQQAFNHVSLSLPPQSQHYAASTTAENDYEKTLFFRGQALNNKIQVPMTNKALAIVNSLELGQKIYQNLQQSTQISAEDKSNIKQVSGARIGLLMLETEAKVQYICQGSN